MFQKTHVREETPQLPRLLPKDAKTLEATAACQRDLDAVQECLQRFREKWFRENPPIERVRGWPLSISPARRSTWRTPPESSAASLPLCSEIRILEVGDLSPSFTVEPPGATP